MTPTKKPVGSVSVPSSSLDYRRNHMKQTGCVIYEIVLVASYDTIHDGVLCISSREPRSR